MNKLQKMRNMLKQSKQLDILHLLNKQQLYKSQQKQTNNQNLSGYSKKQLYFSLVYFSPHNNDFEEKVGSRKEKRNRSTSDKKSNYFLTPFRTSREKRHSFFENIKNVSQILTKPVMKSVRFNQVQWDGEERERHVPSKARCEGNPLKKISENVLVFKPKKQKKMSQVRIRKTKKTQHHCQTTQRTQQLFRLCGWQTLDQSQTM